MKYVYDIHSGIRRVKTKINYVVSGVVLGAAGIGMAMAVPAISHADSQTINFESPYTIGSINGQQGWAGTGGGAIGAAVDQSIASNPGFMGFGTQSFRLSNAYTDGAFGNWPFSPSLNNEAGESTAANSGYSGGVRQPYFEASWDFASASPNEYQNGLQVSASPDRGDGARMSFVRFRDTANGLAVEFSEYKDNMPYGSTGNLSAGCGAEDDFTLTTIASNLDRTKTHSIKIAMTLVDGPRNDIVKVYVDGALTYTGTSWEDYFRYCEGTDTSRTVDSILFQARTSGGNPVSDVAGKGFLFDNLSLLSGPIPVNVPTTLDQCKKDGWKSYGGMFKNQGDCVSYVATKGKNLPSGQ